MTSADAARPRAHDDDARREEDRLGDRVGHEDDGLAGRAPDAQHLGVETLPGHLVERSERLVHEQQGGLERERAGDRDALLHAAGQLVRVVAAEAVELDERRASRGPDAHARRPRRPMTSSGSRTFASTRPPVEEHRRLEDHPVVALEAGLVRRLAVDLDGARAWAR